MNGQQVHENMLNIITYQEMQAKTTVRYYFEIGGVSLCLLYKYYLLFNQSMDTTSYPLERL
jgi:hypothetical protein